MSANNEEFRVAAVTGGAQSIGLAIARSLGERGLAVALLDINEGGASAAAAELGDLGIETASWGLDVSDGEQVSRVMGEVQERFGRIDILVNNAGITRDGLLVRMSEEDWHRVLGVNLTGAFLCSRAVTREMLRRRMGRIVNIA